MQLEHLDPKVDQRGTLVEAYKFPNDGQLFYILINPNETRGNHYHTRKIETFVVIYGTADISAKDRDTGTVMTVNMSGLNPMSVKVMPNNTHNVTAGRDGCILLAWTNEIFNPDDPDTYGEEI